MINHSAQLISPTERVARRKLARVIITICIAFVLATKKENGGR